MNVRKLWLLVAALVMGGLLAMGADKIKAGFIYVGPIGDYGWTHAHDVARRIVDEQYDWLETVYIESVPEGEVETYIDQLVRQGCNVIFTTSFGFIDGTFAAAQRYPNVIFAHASGFKRAPNMATYMADFYQVYYLNGLMAGALTKTGKIGYVGAFPIPELKRHISAFTIGVREVNPTAEVHVRWIYEWYNPAAAKEATEALIAEGCDVFAFTEDSPTVIQVAAERGLASFAHYSPMYAFAPDYVVSGQLVHWEVIYDDFLVKVHEGVYTNKNLTHVDYWWLLAQKAAELGAEIGMPVNPQYVAPLQGYVIDHPTFGRISVYDLVFVRYNQMADPGITFDPFEGPVYDRKGNLVVPAGMWMSYDHLITMEWAADGVVGPWPGEP
ncbi:MAG: BMP family ABC transporter substrate-binding protein [Candidatus Bipolaricaulota bacterium]|nr:BMP family ABC transporter substrate-binding protein [Candidatus Bipolaricaulota bacterium]